MQRSYDSLFHFTTNIDVLISILKKKFKGSYCREEFRYGDQTIEQFVPKISFCDIPEGTLDIYKNYGGYAIGLSKEWAKSKGLNPVLYVESHSLLAKSLIDAYNGNRRALDFLGATAEAIWASWRRSEDDVLKSPIKIDLQQAEESYQHVKDTLMAVNYNQYSLCYIKPYEADLERQEGLIENYRFYDEREWCFVPDFKIFLEKYNIVRPQYLEWRGNGNSKPLLDELMLDFEYDDVSELLVASVEDLEDLSDMIDTLPDEYFKETLGKSRLKSKIRISD
ncbi:MAG: abortive infection system antitoxin AbiGi family protein [Candidatus Pedobacter colombiensis]|uniref:Abortive infection system antitoxin AbiGi family protein n=1 Tax=Candidatus Pedobacter colombiensis TaxID=3121371 RepID=A0AAJ5W3R0_9SPHI|nr:abortive infection system antitoxin AbiGi family protein [Pedobacter sp.]WEK17963.1 MAG: abortive infection system antitoxin AbiGi family protein [Pedobacter sp.]